MTRMIEHAKDAGISVSIAAAGIGVQLSDIDFGIKIVIGAVTLVILGMRAAIVFLDLKHRLKSDGVGETKSTNR